MKKKSRILLCLLAALSLLLAGCQTSAVREAESGTEPGTQAVSSEEVTEETEKSREYIDEAYVDARYGEETEEDLEKYRMETDGTEEQDGSAVPGTSESAQTAGEDNYYTDPIPEGKPQPVEPQEEVVNSDQALTCTLLVECSTILDNMEDLTEGKESLVPSDGVIYGPAAVTFYEGESVYDVLLREMQNNRIHMESEFTAMYNSAYVEGINNLYEFDCGRWSGWMYCVNGWYPNYGCSRYQVQEGDVIEWHYTCDLGRDLGRDGSAQQGE